MEISKLCHQYHNFLTMLLLSLCLSAVFIKFELDQASADARITIKQDNLGLFVAHQEGELWQENPRTVFFSSELTPSESYGKNPCSMEFE